MSKNFSYYIPIAFLAIIFFTLIFDDTPQVQVQNNIQLQKTPIPIIKEKSYEDVEIVFSGDNTKINDKNTKPNLPQVVERKEVDIANYQDYEKKEDKIYELIGTGVDVAGFYINVASNSPIPARNPSSFPRIPATISGKIDGKYFSMVVPSDLKVKDLKVKVQNQKSGEIKYIKLGAEHLQAGASNVLNIDSNNFENIELRSDASDGPPLPPLPPIPSF
jgi:hypothetical protein